MELADEEQKENVDLDPKQIHSNQRWEGENSSITKAKIPTH